MMGEISQVLEANTGVADDAGADPTTRVQLQIDALLKTMADTLYTVLKSDVMAPRDREDAVRSLTSDIARASRRIDLLVDELPVTDTTERQQLDEMARLQAEGDAATADLIDAKADADYWLSHVRELIATVAKDRLRASVATE